MSVNSSLDKNTDEQEFQDFFQLFFEQEEEEEEHHDDGDEDKEGRTSTMRATNDLKHHPPNQCDYVSGRGVSPPARCDYTSTRHRLQPKKNTEDRPQELILDHYQEQRERRIMALSSSAAASSLANSIIDEEISEVRTTAKKQHMASRITMRSIQNPKNTNTTSAFINRTDSTARRSVDEQGDNSQLQLQEDTAVVLSSGSSGMAIDKNGSNKMISIHRNSPAWGSSSTMETTSWSLSNKDTLGSGVGFRKRRDIDITRNSLACQPPFKKRMAPPVIEQNADLIGTNQQQHHQRHSNEEDSSSRPTFSSCNTEGQYRGMNVLSRELSGRDSLSVFNAATSNPCVLSATSAEDEEVNKSNKKDLPEQDNKLLVEKGIKGNQNAVNVVSSNDFYLLQQGHQMGEHVNHTMMMRYYEQMLLRNSLNSTMALFTPNVAVPYSGYVTPSFLPLQPAKIQQPNSASAIRMQSPQVEPSYDLECKNTTSRENTNNIGQRKKDISIENVSLSTRRRKQTKERERRAELTTKFQVLADLLKDIEQAESHDILYPSNFSTDQKDKVVDKLKKNQELAALSQDDHFNLSNRVEIITKTVDILQKLRQTNKSLQQMVTELRDSKRQSE